MRREIEEEVCVCVGGGGGGGCLGESDFSSFTCLSFIDYT